MTKKAFMVSVGIVAWCGLAISQEPTPTPAATPTPDPAPPLGKREDGAAGPTVTAASAPDDYWSNRQRGMVRLEDCGGNCSFHDVQIPVTRPLAIADINFTQRTTRVVFWQAVDLGTAGATTAIPSRFVPNGRTPTAADIGLKVRILPAAGWARGVYRITGQNGVSWFLDRAPAQATTSGGKWVLLAPVRDLTGITFSGCNLRNAWLPGTSLRPTLVSSPNIQADLDPETP